MKDNPRIDLPRNRRILSTFQGSDGLYSHPATPEEFVAKIDYISGTPGRDPSMVSGDSRCFLRLEGDRELGDPGGGLRSG